MKRDSWKKFYNDSKDGLALKITNTESLRIIDSELRVRRCLLQYRYKKIVWYRTRSHLRNDRLCTEKRERKREREREREKERERNCQLSQLRAAVCRAMIYTRCSRRLFTTYVTWDDKSSLAGSPLCVTRAHKLHSDGQILSHMAARYTFPPSPIIFIYIFYIHFALVSLGILRFLLVLFFSFDSQVGEDKSENAKRLSNAHFWCERSRKQYPQIINQHFIFWFPFLP